MTVAPSKASNGSGQVVSLDSVNLCYGKVEALKDIRCQLPGGKIVGLIGPDGVGKSSLLALIAGARQIQQGRVEALGGDMASARHRRQICARIAYMPQGLGKNLYPTLSVEENLDFFGRLFGHDRAERKRRISQLLASTGLSPFAQRPAGKLSGGMKQKLGLCCALIHDPDLLILDEPTTGVDPLSRRQFWQLIDQIRASRPGLSVVVATAYMEEAEQFDWLLAMNDGRILATGTPQQLRASTGTDSLEKAFMAFSETGNPQDSRLSFNTRASSISDDIAIEARHLTMRFGDFTAVDNVSFRIRRGEIFGFLGSNGCGKTTTMKMLTGLLPATSGECFLFGQVMNPKDMAVRRRVGYMSQSFSLYSELTVQQNLELHAKLFQIPAQLISDRVDEMIRRFSLKDVADCLPDKLPLGQRQRLSLAVAIIHKPDILILDEPTSGVDPAARDSFWHQLLELAHRDGVTIFISTHFMNEAQRCDRISLMHAGKVLVSDTPDGIIASQPNAKTLENAFVAYLEAASDTPPPSATATPHLSQLPQAATKSKTTFASLGRLLSYSRREALELWRDPLRSTLALLGSVILMIVVGFGITMDVENLSFAVLDRDETTTSREYIQNLEGSRYFSAHPPLRDYAELDRRMSSGEISLALEIPDGFARDLRRGNPVTIGAWIDGAMPQRAETLAGYVQGIHNHWLQHAARKAGRDVPPNFTIETRYRYNPDIKSLVAIVPAVIPILLMLIPAMLTTLSVVREKELGSIINFYVTPVRPLEFLVGKQLPYIALGTLSFLLLLVQSVFMLGVELKGSFSALFLATLLYICTATAFGLLMSAFTRSQVAAMFGTAVLTLLPAVKFSGMIDPVSSLEGPGRWLGEIYPTTYYLIITRGTFSKGLSFSDLDSAFIPIAVAIPVLLGLCALLLNKQER